METSLFPSKLGVKRFSKKKLGVKMPKILLLEVTFSFNEVTNRNIVRHF